MKKINFTDDISDETLAILFDKTLRVEKNLKNRDLKATLFKMGSVVAAIVLVIGLVSILPVFLNIYVEPTGNGANSENLYSLTDDTLLNEIPRNEAINEIPYEPINGIPQDEYGREMIAAPASGITIFDNDYIFYFKVLTQDEINEIDRHNYYRNNQGESGNFFLPKLQLEYSFIYGTHNDSQICEGYHNDDNKSRFHNIKGNFIYVVNILANCTSPVYYELVEPCEICGESGLMTMAKFTPRIWENGDNMIIDPQTQLTEPITIYADMTPEQLEKTPSWIIKLMGLEKPVGFNISEYLEATEFIMPSTFEEYGTLMRSENRNKFLKSLDWDNAVPVEGSFKEVIKDENGMLDYPVINDEKGDYIAGGGKYSFDDLFENNGIAQLDISGGFIARLDENGNLKINQRLLSMDENGKITAVTLELIYPLIN